MYDYTKLVKIDYNGGTGYSTKDGIVMVQDGAKATNGTAGSRTAGSYYIVKVDVNGSKGPNKDGRDIFKLYVDTQGLVIPFGSILGEGYTTDWVLWTTGCPSNKKGEAKVVPTDKVSCSGSVVDNGGKVLYHYEGIR